MTTNHKESMLAFVKLGDLFREFYETGNNSNPGNGQSQWLSDFENILNLAEHKNGWFTKENVLFAIKGWADLLTGQNLNDWLSAYDLDKNRPKTVALIMAGNIPLVGFHDFLSVLLTGNEAIIKLSSNDDILLPFITKYLIEIAPSLKGRIIFAENKLKDFDAVIATGSDNTSRYFEYYFSHKPNVIRKNRNSIAVLTGKETKTQLKALGEDVFRYYGLGCRSVSKLFVPRGYDFNTFFEAIYSFNPIMEQVKYTNNYDYNKAVYLMSRFHILENGFLMLREEESYASPIATLFYGYYDSMAELKQRLYTDRKKIQCIVSEGLFDHEIKFGQTQRPGLDDYADGIDIVEFLLKT